jgi:glucose/arabinose dehydrogenase
LPVTFRICLAALLVMPVIGGAGRAQAGDEIKFPQTGFSLSDAHGFLSYWNAHGGLPQFGYPLSPEVAEVSPTNGQLYITQWFERNRFEYHPENKGSPYEVLLGLLGHDLAKGRESEGPFRPLNNPPASNCLSFQETGHTLCGTFRQYWEQHGGLPLYGYPLSEEFTELSPTNHQPYTVQYFERNRFEYHPENKGSPYEVLLGLLGVQIGGFPVPDLPKADTQVPLQVPDKFKSITKWNTPHTLTAPAGTKINLYGLAQGPRMMAVAPDGDLFVSDFRVGKVLVLPDRDGDGVADDSLVFAEAITKPHGLAFHNGYLYVATEAVVLRFPYANGQLKSAGQGEKIADLPSGTSQGLVKDVNHDTRSITFGPDNKMYVSMGSDCDACQEGDPRRATIMQFNDDGTGGRIFAAGLRNAVGIDIDPRTGRLWASVNERNTRGNDLPPDYLTPIRDKGDYGWPYCMGIPQQPDPAFGKSADFCQAKDAAAVALPPHMAPLGIRFYNGGFLPSGYDYGIFIAMHGSLLHDPTYGYEVRFVSLRPGKMAQGSQVVITGWLVDGKYWGRPVDIVFGQDGAMYITDDASGAIYKVSFQVSPCCNHPT